MDKPYWLIPTHDRQCKAKSKRSGQQCRNYACKGRLVCRMHGGRSTGAKTDKGRENARRANLKHGRNSIYLEKVRFMEELLAWFRKEFGRSLWKGPGLDLKKKIWAMTVEEFRQFRKSETQRMADSTAKWSKRDSF